MLFIVGLILWELIVIVFNIQGFLLPRPTVIAATFVNEFPVIISDGLFTLREAVGGFVIGSTLGLLVALATARWVSISEGVMPFAIAINSTPIVALAPIMNNWFGLTNPISKMSIVAVIVFFPVMINIVRGLTQVNPGALELMKSYAAKDFHVLAKTRIPNALPYLFSALKVASTLSIIARLTDSKDYPLLEPSYIAIEPKSGKVYITNHAHGRPSGWVTVIDGFTNRIVKSIYPDPGGELYGITADTAHDHIYLAAVNAANIYVIDAATDTQLGSFQVRRWSDNQPVPLRMIAVNPNPGVGTKVRLWLTSSSTEDNGLDNVIALTGNWPNLESPALGADLPPSPERGIKFDPVNKYLFIASASANRVTILRDTPETQQCLWPFVEPHGPTRAGSLYVVVNQTTR